MDQQVWDKGLNTMAAWRRAIELSLGDEDSAVETEPPELIGDRALADHIRRTAGELLDARIFIVDVERGG